MRQPDHRRSARLRALPDEPSPGVRRGFAAIVFGLALAAGNVPSAWARSEKTLAYPRDQVWPTAVRFLVVDERVKVTEKDADAGYVMFELRDDGKTFRGALEVVTVVRDGRPSVRFVLQIEDRPSWLELAMLKRLEAKLHIELGSPSPPASEPAKDHGKDGDGPRDGSKDAPRPAPKPDDTDGGHALRISPTP